MGLADFSGEPLERSLACFEGGCSVGVSEGDGDLMNRRSPPIVSMQLSVTPLCACSPLVCPVVLCCLSFLKALSVERGGLKYTIGARIGCHGLDQ